MMRSDGVVFGGAPVGDPAARVGQLADGCRPKSPFNAAPVLPDLQALGRVLN